METYIHAPQVFVILILKTVVCYSATQRRALEEGNEAHNTVVWHHQPLCSFSSSDTDWKPKCVCLWSACSCPCGSDDENHRAHELQTRKRTDRLDTNSAERHAKGAAMMDMLREKFV